jgi:type II secretory pathway pseudopilin PulG
VKRGFTLVKTLVVIVIIGLLAALAVLAVIMARNMVRNHVIASDVTNLEMACRTYKKKFGEYPPDFAFVNDSSVPARQTAAQAVVLRHLARAFPRYNPGGVGTWDGFTADLATANIDATCLSPRTALAFWLGGIPDPDNDFLPSGFAADSTNPFQTPAKHASRIPPFFDFDSTRLKPILGASESGATRAWLYWPKGISVDVGGGSDNVGGAITYFRAENGVYGVTYTDATGNIKTDTKAQTDLGDQNSPQGVVWPAVDMRSSSTGPIYVNPQSVQIFSSGLDVRFGAYSSTNAVTISGTKYNLLAFPTGDNYLPQTYDNITNFSGGKLESAMP